MPRALPPLTWFRAFDAAARHLSFTVAADELGLTQSAVSQHIRSLETRLGSSLFVRQPRGLALTDAGRRLVPDVAAAMLRLRTATETFLPPAEHGLLTVAASVSVTQWFIAPGLSELQRSMPELRIRLVTAVWPDDFTAAEADIEIRFGTREVAGTDATPLDDGTIAAVAAPAMLDADNLTDADWPQLLSRPLIQPVGVSETWRKLSRRVGGPAELSPSLFVDSHGLAVDLAVAGAGIALTSAFIAAPALAVGRLLRLPIPETLAGERYYLAVNGDPEVEAPRRFVAWLQEKVAIARDAG